MASYVTPLRATEFITYVGLSSQADTKIFQANPTLAAGDVKVSIDGGALNNLNTLPAVTPAGGKLVKVTLSAAEMTGDNLQVIFSDAAGAEWCDLVINIQTTTRQIDNLSFPNTTGRGIDVTATGAVGIDWANVENPTTTLDLANTEILNSATQETQIAALNNLSQGEVVSAVQTINALPVPDAVAAEGDLPSINEALLMITRFLMEKSLSGTTMTVNKEDGTTASMTFTLNDSTAPTSISRAS